MISILCCYNDKACLDDMLISSLNKQKIKYELITIDCKEKGYTSAAQAYNREIINANGDIIIFCHQDIAFDESFLEIIQEIFHKQENIILGLAGMKKDGMVSSNLKYMNNKEYITRRRVNKELELAESVDECFIAITKQNFMKIKFDENICNGWHLYGVDLCYKGKKAPLSIKPVITNVSAYHKLNDSSGLEVDINFLKCINKLARKYKEEQYIYAPCYVVSTLFPKKQFKLLKSRIRIMLEGKKA